MKYRRLKPEDQLFDPSIWDYGGDDDCSPDPPPESSEQFVASLLSVNSSEAPDPGPLFPKFRRQLLGFFETCYGVGFKLTPSQRERIKRNGIVVAFSSDMNLAKYRMTRPRIERLIKALRAGEKNVRKVIEAHPHYWYDSDRSGDLFQRVTRPLSQALQLIGQAQIFIEELESDIPKGGGRPRDRNIEGLIRCLGELFIVELHEAWKERHRIEIPEIEDFSGRLEDNLMLRPVDAYIVRLIGNFLFSTNLRKQISGLTIKSQLQGDERLWKLLKRIRIKQVARRR